MSVEDPHRFCVEKSISFAELDEIVECAVSKYSWRFPKRVVDRDDIKQQCYLELVPRFPCVSTGFIFNTCKFAISTFWRWFYGDPGVDKTLERGGGQNIEHNGLFDGSDIDMAAKEEPDLMTMQDCLDFLKTHLSEEEIELWEAASERRLTTLSHEKGFKNPGVMGYRWNRKLKPRLVELANNAILPARPGDWDFG